MDIKFDDSAILKVVTAAIVQQLGDSKTLVDDAIAHLLSNKTTKVQYGEDIVTQPIQEAFHRAIDQVAVKVILEYLKDNEVLKSAIQQVAIKATEQVLEEGIDDVAKIVSDAIVVKIQKVRWGE